MIFCILKTDRSMDGLKNDPKLKVTLQLAGNVTSWFVRT
jgi:hypothetical protein